VDGALDYKVEISSDSAFTTLVESGTVKDVTYTSTAVLPAGVTLYWRVQADGNSSPGLWSNIFSFTTTVPLEIPTLITPADGALIPDYRPTLVWNAVQVREGLDFAYYHVQIAVDNTFATPLIDIQQPDLASSSYTLVDDLGADSIFFWRVKVSYANGQSSDWSDARSFRTPIQPPILISPGNGTADVGLRPELGWQEVIGASGYTVEISSDADFAIVLESGSTKDLVFLPTADLPSNTILYWRVQADGNNGPGLWSDIYDFTTQSQ
jgi:hypothetical protein